MSGLLGPHHPLLRQGALPAQFAGGGVGGGAQLDDGTGQRAAGGLQGAGIGMLGIEQAHGTFAGPLDGVEGSLDTVAGPPVGDRDRRGEAHDRTHQGVRDPVGHQLAGLLDAGELGDEQRHGGRTDAAEPVVAADQGLGAEVEGEAQQDEERLAEMGQRSEHGEEEDTDQVADDALHSRLQVRVTLAW